jgi:dTDP-4-dehydrorhamnose reductase
LNLLPETRVLITGASGALGWALAARLSGHCRIAGTYCSHDCVPGGVEPVRMDLADPDGLDDAVRAVSPQVIVHTAAMTDPDACERDPALARAVNLEGSLRLAGLAATMGARPVFISTDLVFDGMRGGYREADEAEPLSVYGRTKLEAERGFLGVAGAAVMRSSLIYGWGSPTSGTFFTGLYAALKEGSGMRLFTDQLRNPVSVEDLAVAVMAVIERDLSGLYHVGGPDVVSRLEFGAAVCRVFGFDESRLEPISMKDFEYVARRPVNSTLDVSRFAAAAGWRPRRLVEGLESLMADRPIDGGRGGHDIGT